MPVTYYTDSFGTKRPLLNPNHHHDGVYALATHSHPGDDTGWIDLSYINDWYNYGGNYASGQYRRLHGIVYLKGLIRRSASTPDVTGDANIIAYLPGGFRPLEQHIFIGANQYSESSVPRHAQRVDIMPDGAIRPQYYNDRDGDTWQSISGITFFAEQ